MADVAQPANSLSMAIGKLQEQYHVLRGKHRQERAYSTFFGTAQSKENEPENTENNMFLCYRLATKLEGLLIVENNSGLCCFVSCYKHVLSNIFSFLQNTKVLLHEI